MSHLPKYLSAIIKKNMNNRTSPTPWNLFVGIAVICMNICLLTPAFSQTDTSIEFKNHGKIINTITLTDLAAISPAISLNVFEVHENKDRTYKAYPAQSLFNHAFGKEWQTTEEIVFTSLDGYQASIPVTKFLAHDAYFAFSHNDNSPFTMINTLQNNEVVQLGPLYLIWDNKKSKILLRDGASDMPYQVKSIELTTFAARFPNTSPPQKSSAEARHGFLYFRKYCMVCHTINGEGGSKAPELNYPTSVVEYIKPEDLIRWIENPSTIRHNTMMPGLAQTIPNRTQVAREIVAYLKTMSATKRKPIQHGIH